MDKSIITFSANEQNLQKTGGIGCYASDTVSYIEAHFALGENWSGYDSIRAVWFNDYKTISTVLDSDGVCIVPHEVLTSRGKVMVNLVGSVLVSDELSDRLTTFPCEALKVSAKAKISGSETAAVTPSQFEQFVSIVISEVEKVTGMTAQAETLPAGSQATARYENGILYLGIPQGMQGERGETGADGADGNGIASVVYNADYSLTLVFDNGERFTTPPIRGATGATGATGNGIESAVLNADYTLTLTFTDGTSYTTPSIRGATGATGATGNGISSVTLTSTSGAVKTYTIAFTDGTNTTFDVTDGEVTQAVLDEAVTDLKSDLGANTVNINASQTGRYKHNNSTGVIEADLGSTTIIGMSKKVPCNSDSDYIVTIYTPNNTYGTLYVAFYDNDEVFIENKEISQYVSPYVNGSYVHSSANAKYIHAFMYKSGGFSIDNAAIQIEENTYPTPLVKPFSANDEAARIGQVGQLNIKEHSGYINSDGSISYSTTSANEAFTDKIDLRLVNSIGLALEYATANKAWAFYAVYDASGAFIERKLIIEDSGLTRTKWGCIITELNANARYIAFTYRKYDGGAKVIGSAPSLEELNLLLDTSGISNDSIRSFQNASNSSFTGRFRPCYDHLFVDHTGDEIVVPHESLYHVRISKAMGFNTIEANVYKTSDDVYIVNHLANGKFGAYFHHIDGVTDISNTLVSSVTWDWIVANVRYNSTIPKYRTRPCRLEEFLSECRQQNIIPFITATDSSVIALADKYLGKDNYIAYGASRDNCPSAIIYHWLSYSTKSDIINYCERMGKPFIYGMSNPTSFTDSALKEIIDELHSRGFWIGTSYVDANWHKYSAFGFDFNGTQQLVNRIKNGNLCNFNTIFGFDDFDFTNATESDGVLTYSSNGTLSPKVDNTTQQLCMVDCEIWFNGSMTLTAVGEASGWTYTSDGSQPVFVAFPILNNSPKIVFTVVSGTTIYDVKFKASIC